MSSGLLSRGFRVRFPTRSFLFKPLRLKLAARHTRLSDNRQKRPRMQLGVIRHRDGNSPFKQLLLHHNMASASPHFPESMVRRNGAHLFTRENAQPTQA